MKTRMSGTNPLILIIEDELATRRFLRVALASQGYRLAEAVAGRTGLAQAATLRPDLIILELELRDIDGLHLMEQLREWASTPIVVLSARCQEDAKVAALDAGADDYLTKPCSTGELLARMRVALRRAAGAGQKLSEPIITIGELRMDLAMRRVFLGVVAVHLTPIEYRLLITLAQHAGKVLTHPQLLKQVWGPAHANAAHYLHVYMAHLRRKLETDPAPLRPNKCQLLSPKRRTACASTRLAGLDTIGWLRSPLAGDLPPSVRYLAAMLRAAFRSALR